MNKKQKPVPVDYASVATPPAYTCYACKATGVKLWRDGNYCDKGGPTLYCLACACKKEGRTLTPTEDGKSLYTGKTLHWYQHDKTWWAASGEYQFWQGWSGVLGKEPTGPNIRFKSERERMDQVGRLLPAVMTAEGDTFWGYISVPPDALAWWYGLPYAKETP